MAKRFSETLKWQDPWYRKLTPDAKCLWQWFLDNCDHAGVIDPDLELAAFQIGYQYPNDTLLGSLRGRVDTLPNGKMWIPGFVPFQYGELSPNCPAHKPAIKSVEKNGLDTLMEGYPKGSDTQQDKDKSKSKDKAKVKDKRGLAELSLPHGEQFKSAWTDWIQHRKEIKKPLKPTQTAAQIKNLGKMTEAEAVAMILHTIEKGWQGLKAPDTNGKGQHRAAKTEREYDEPANPLPILNQ